MKDQGEQQIRLPLSWSFIEGARSDIAFALASFPTDVREAAVMVVSELAENAVKYGEPVSGEDCAYISYSIRPEIIVIRTINGVSSPSRVTRVAASIDAVSLAEDVGTLYAKRLSEMLNTPAEADSRLGLLRIAYEGRFRLAYSYASPILTITATRALT